MMSPLLVVLVALVLFALVVLWSGVKVVPQGSEWTVERFGKYVRTLEPGLQLITPFFDQIGRKINVQEGVIEIPSQVVITKDNATVTVDGVVFYQVLDVAKAAYEVQNLDRAMVALTLTNIRTAIGSMDLDETLSKRDEINARLLKVLDEATHVWGTKVTRVELKDVSPPEDVIQAMAKQLTAERNKRATILQAEGVKESKILTAEGDKQAQVLAAEARLAAAQKDAEARERLAEAEAKATEAVSKAIAGGNIQAINYFVATKYVDAISRLAAAQNAKVILMPLEASSVIGSIAGIAELAKGAGAAAATPQS
ncbi:MAG TPA: SPFH domain-containing protein [Stellaceae bacterium]|nr:SPFH domain-containing protein [Stellaceae bacterium]